MGWLRDKMVQDMELRGFSKVTKVQYLMYARRYARHCMRCPSTMGEKAFSVFVDEN
ncbi:MAG: hypothetical protein GY854_24630 [Deltaproteobacteria bacterium]|nr:hypothetical protein [Deltaproteobacteria bacterium]